jgi:hypothetical protein
MDGACDARALRRVIGRWSAVMDPASQVADRGPWGKAWIGTLSGSRAPRLCARGGLLPIPVRAMMPSRCGFTRAGRATLPAAVAAWKGWPRASTAPASRAVLLTMARVTP